MPSKASNQFNNLMSNKNLGSVPKRMKEQYNQSKDIASTLSNENSDTVLHIPIYPKVRIINLTNIGMDYINSSNIPHLGHTVEATYIASKLKLVQDTLKQQSKKILLLERRGNKVPRGVDVGNDRKIGRTQNGQVVSASGEFIGTYDRITEFGGDTNDIQQMLVYVN